ncbi:DUF7161 family protein [Mycolicibacterium brumae]|uniref:UbiD family decarboxylase n=1 Tax=Mycolicibacterium brumae TaxID=85968 RepID=A0A2G5P739_9MYCO|nr:ubiD family decarboxylase [Mycolicibacterium brumae]MCV7194584.1 ubiD family decarboxylase [Mycolicibacterium brumae]PIB74188.1 ubiD family decarboxylase [Mycolicibacterium brumae]RWA22977.1 hypothetical protein MBRU_11600 [Mycolicibacterium brumae DSM 44177]UWW08924.1 ubiD family decarboxylase [Mycolicibacterium brumae]
MADVPAGFRPVRWDDSGLRGRRARIIADPGVYYDLPPDEADVVIVDDEPNIYAELTVALPEAADRRLAIHHSCLAVTTGDEADT